MNIESITVGLLEVNCYIVSGIGKQALVIDPGADPEIILDFLETHQLSVASYLVTHGHADHISALSSVSQHYNAPIGMHGADLKWAFSTSNQIAPFYAVPECPAKIDRIFEQGQKWTEAGMTYEILATPGHSQGSVCFYFPEEHVLFSGDTLFRGSVGRTDLPGSDPNMLAQSLQKIACLPNETVIYPGHGPKTTLCTELQTNPFLKSI